MLAFAVGGAVAGFAGALFVTKFGFVSPALVGVAMSTEVLIWTALGGREVLMAAFAGALIVRSVEGVLSAALGHYWLLALGVLFILTVVVMFYGVLGLANVADKADKTGSGYPKLSAEYIVASDPDLIVLSDTLCCAQNAAKVPAARRTAGRSSSWPEKTSGASTNPFLSHSRGRRASSAARPPAAARVAASPWALIGTTLVRRLGGCSA